MFSMNVVLIWVRTHEVMRPTTATICDPGTFQVNFYCYPYAPRVCKSIISSFNIHACAVNQFLGAKIQMIIRLHKANT